MYTCCFQDHLIFGMSNFGLAVRWTSVWVCLGSLFSSNIVVCRHCLVTLSPTPPSPNYLNTKMAHTTAHLNAEWFWWWRCSMRYSSPFLPSPWLPVPAGISSETVHLALNKSNQETFDLLVVLKMVLNKWTMIYIARKKHFCTRLFLFTEQTSNSSNIFLFYFSLLFFFIKVYLNFDRVIYLEKQF